MSGFAVYTEIAAGELDRQRKMTEIIHLHKIKEEV
jgi:hypothetical protein